MRVMDARRRTMVLGGVMLAHVLLLQLWMMASRRNAAFEDAPTIRLSLRQLEVERDRARERERPWELPRLAVPPVRVITEVPAFDVDGTVAGTPVAGDSTSGSTTGRATSDGPGTSHAPLRLAPSREAIQGAFANPAAVDPRANSPKPNSMERMAMAIDRDLCLLVDRAPDGSDRRRWGRYTEMAPAITEQTGLKGKPVRVCVG